MENIYLNVLSLKIPCFHQDTTPFHWIQFLTVLYDIHYIFFFIRQASLVETNRSNAGYIIHYNNSLIQLQVNRNVVTSLNATFPKHVTNIFYHTMLNLKNEKKNLMSPKFFKAGRTIFVWVSR